MRFGKQSWRLLTAFALVALASSTVFAQSVTTRIVNAGLATTTAKIVPGGSVSTDVRLDIVGANIFGTGFTLTQLTPAGSGFISITGRSFTGSPFTDATSGTPDATVLAAASALLDPANNDNLGRTTVGQVGIAPANDVLAVNLTLTASGATPLGTYTVGPTAGVSFATDEPAFNDYDMSGGTPFTIIVGQTLTVTKSGTGTGTVTADSGAINCGATCSDIYPGTLVTLTATPAGGSTFGGWSGACTGTGTCVVTVDAAKSVNALFNGPPGLVTLTVSKSGTGTGTVTSDVGGINCGATCSASVSAGTVVTLTATPTTGVFTGWSGGGCSGTGTCVVTVNVATTVTANFAPPQFVLTVSKAGTGTGTVTSNVGGINCGATCSSTPLNSGTIVTLTATPTVPGSAFTGWSGGGCSGTGTCLVTLTAATTVTATFTLDSTPPDTIINSTPTDPSGQANPVFTFSSTEPNSTFQCSLDNGAFVSCTSPRTLTVASGPHTFTVFATDQAGNPDPTPATFSWTAIVVSASVTPVPTLSEWTLALLTLMVGLFGVAAFRRRG